MRRSMVLSAINSLIIFWPRTCKRIKLLVEGDLTLDRALDISQALEAWESQSRQIAEDNQFAV